MALQGQIWRRRREEERVRPGLLAGQCCSDQAGQTVSHPVTHPAHFVHTRRPPQHAATRLPAPGYRALGLGRLLLLLLLLRLLWPRTAQHTARHALAQGSARRPFGLWKGCWLAAGGGGRAPKRDGGAQRCRLLVRPRAPARAHAAASLLAGRLRACGGGGGHAGHAQPIRDVQRLRVLRGG